MENKDTRDLNCKNCGNFWPYSGGQKYYATCPRCLRKVKIPQDVEVEK